MLHIILVEPEIPQNTGNIARTCAATWSVLHLCKPLGFSLADKYLRRAGLDYWPLADIQVHESFEAAKKSLEGIQFFYATVRGSRNYAEVSYPLDAAFVFGRESCGLPQELLAANYDWCVRIPMRKEARSLNLANSVAVLTYEYLRQHGFLNLKTSGSPVGDGGAQWEDYL